MLPLTGISWSVRCSAVRHQDMANIMSAGIRPRRTRALYGIYLTMLIRCCRPDDEEPRAMPAHEDGLRKPRADAVDERLFMWLDASPVVTFCTFLAANKATVSYCASPPRPRHLECALPRLPLRAKFNFTTPPGQAVG